AFSQCVPTSDENSHAIRSGALPPRPISGVRSTNLTCRQVEWPRARVLSYELPLHRKPSSGTPFHSLHATSHALHPMQSVESVKKPVTAIRGVMLARSVPRLTGSHSNDDEYSSPERASDNQETTSVYDRRSRTSRRRAA